MAYLENSVQDLDDIRLGNLIVTTLQERNVITVEVRTIQNRRTMRIWYRDGDGSGDPIDDDELDNRL
jgi:hypothetical protein